MSANRTARNLSRAPLSVKWAYYGGVRGGRCVRESTIARARASTVPPKESSGADTAATMLPVRVSARRTYSQLGEPGRTLRILGVEAGQRHSPRRAVDEFQFADVHPHMRHPGARSSGEE